tara:strand:- start:337 stop:516 length:180 start_codon:yes stop_codon:yes gene_type:complete
MGKNIVVNKLDEFYNNHDKIQIPIMYYVDDDGNKVYDTEEMTREFEVELEKLENGNYKH